jgi:hypothetical protein
MRAGSDLAGNELSAPLHLCTGAVVAPEADNVELQLIKLRKKVDAGAQFIQTQAVFDPAAFARFMERAELAGIPVLAGIIPVTSPRMARFMNARIPGVNVPTWVIQRLNEAEIGGPEARRGGDRRADRRVGPATARACTSWRRAGRRCCRRFCRSQACAPRERPLRRRRCVRETVVVCVG